MLFESLVDNESLSNLAALESLKLAPTRRLVQALNVNCDWRIPTTPFVDNFEFQPSEVFWGRDRKIEFLGQTFQDTKVKLEPLDALSDEIDLSPSKLQFIVPTAGF